MPILIWLLNIQYILRHPVLSAREGNLPPTLVYSGLLDLKGRSFYRSFRALLNCLTRVLFTCQRFTHQHPSAVTRLDWILTDLDGRLSDLVREAIQGWLEAFPEDQERRERPRKVVEVTL